MTSWVFEGILLPAGETDRLEFGRAAGDAEVLPGRYGVRVLAGSDVVGSVAGEVDLLVKHGLAVTQALAAASTAAQDYLGLTATGNLVTYDADPRNHPEILATPAAVILHHRRIH
jgi:hypothetical protein